MLVIALYLVVLSIVKYSCGAIVIVILYRDVIFVLFSFLFSTCCRYFSGTFLLAYVVLPSRLCGIIFHPVKLSFVCVLLSENVGMVARSRREINGTWTHRCRL